MQTSLETLKQHVTQDAANPEFIHHQWFVAHHLDIVDQLVTEFLEKYTDADPILTRAMVWVHDWGKILTNKGKDEEDVTRQKIRETLPTFGFTQDACQKIETIYKEMEDLEPQGTEFLRESQIISTADAFSHYIGPFFSLYFYENPEKSVSILIADNYRKVEKDRKKVLLKEWMTTFETLTQPILENDATYRQHRYLSVR